jgi:hypothetical protein
VALSTLVPTATGLRAIAELSVGDRVFDELGRPCRVTGVYDVWPERCHRLSFSDGAEVLASGDHLWVTWTKNERHHFFRRGGRLYRQRGPKPVGYPDGWAAMRPPERPTSWWPPSGPTTAPPTTRSRWPARSPIRSRRFPSTPTSSASGSATATATSPA